MLVSESMPLIKTAEATEAALLQPAQDELERLGKDIVALHAAGDKNQKKANDKYLAAGLKLIEARKQVPSKMSFETFLDEHCPGIGKSRAYELIEMAEGRKTPQEIREANNKRQRLRRQRQRERARPGAQITLPPPELASVTSRTRSEEALIEIKDAIDDRAVFICVKTKFFPLFVFSQGSASYLRYGIV
jgi:hypothetical protein